MKSSNYLKEVSNKFENSKYFAESLKKHSEGLQLMAADPATIAEIVGTIISLMEFLNGNETDPVFQEIVDDLEKIIELLDQVIDLLIELKFLIKEEFRRNVQEDLKAAMTVISDNYVGWRDSLNSGDPQRIQQARQEITLSYNDLQTKARKAFSYGYGYCNNIAMAFNLEYFLTILLNKDNGTKRNVINRYINYFELAINYNVPDSLASAQKLTIENMNSLEANYPTPKTFYVGRGTKRSGAPRCESYYDYYLHVEGNIKAGFTFRQEEKYIGTYCESRSLIPQDVALRFITAPFAATIIPAPQIIESYNKAYDTYHKILLVTLDTLTKSIESCKEYIAILIRIRQTLP